MCWRVTCGRSWCWREESWVPPPPPFFQMLTLPRGKTPLLYSLKKQHGDIARQLIRSGADVFSKDNKNRSSLDLCRIFGTIDPAEILQIVNSRDEPDQQAELDSKEKEERAREQAKINHQKSLIKQAVVLFNQKPEKVLYCTCGFSTHITQGSEFPCRARNPHKNTKGNRAVLEEYSRP